VEAEAHPIQPGLAETAETEHHTEAAEVAGAADSHLTPVATAATALTVSSGQSALLRKNQMAILLIDIPREVKRLQDHVIPKVSSEDAQAIIALITDTELSLEQGTEDQKHTLYEKLRAINTDNTLVECLERAEEWRTARLAQI